MTRILLACMFIGALIIFALSVPLAHAITGSCYTDVENNGQTSYTYCTYYDLNGVPNTTVTVCYSGQECIIH